MIALGGGVGVGVGVGWGGGYFPLQIFMLSKFFVYVLSVMPLHSSPCLLDLEFLYWNSGQKEVLFPPFCKFTPKGMQLHFSSRSLVSKVSLSIHLTHQFQSLDDLRAKKRLIHEQVLEMVMKELERELYWEMEHSKNPIKAKDCSYIIDKILEQGRAHINAQYAIIPLEGFDDNVSRWLIEQTMDVKQMCHGKFALWIRGDGAEHLDMGLLEWKREWIKSKRKQLSMMNDEERAAMALTLCRSLGLLRRDVTERNELGETPLLAAAACGERQVLAQRAAHCFINLILVCTAIFFVLRCLDKLY